MTSSPTAPAIDQSLAEYLQDHYGRCSLTPCQCLKPGARWLGRMCAFWVPSGAMTWGALRNWMNSTAAPAAPGKGA